MGIWVFADDIILLAPSRSGLQQMTTICERFADMYDLKFSTNVDVVKSKTKCVIFSKTVIDVNSVRPIMLDNLPLPFVNEIKHLGNVLQSDNSMTKDCSIKRACFISKIHSLNQEFYFSEPKTLMKLYNIYTCSFHGSHLWDLYCNNVVRLYSSWNMAVKVVFNLPRATHRYFIEPISEKYHLKTMLCSRFVSFFHSLKKSNKIAIRLLSNAFQNNLMTTLGKNIYNIAQDCNCYPSDLTKLYVKSNLTFAEVSDDNFWKIPFLKELLSVRSNEIEIPGFERDELSQIINYLCCD